MLFRTQLSLPFANGTNGTMCMVAVSAVFFCFFFNLSAVFIDLLWRRRLYWHFESLTKFPKEILKSVLFYSILFRLTSQTECIANPWDSWVPQEKNLWKGKVIKWLEELSVCHIQYGPIRRLYCESDTSRTPPPGYFCKLLLFLEATVRSSSWLMSECYSRNKFPFNFICVII